MQNLENELQLFGFTALQQSLERRYLIQKKLNDALKVLLEKVGVSNRTVGSLVAQKNVVLENILLSLEEDLKSLDALDEKYFTVPGHVLLETDFAFAKGYTDETERNLDEKISGLNKLYLENCVFETLLKDEITRFTSIKPFLDDEIETHAQLKQCLSLVDLDISKVISKTKDLSDKVTRSF